MTFTFKISLYLLLHWFTNDCILSHTNIKTQFNPIITIQQTLKVPSFYLEVTYFVHSLNFIVVDGAKSRRRRSSDSGNSDSFC